MRFHWLLVREQNRGLNSLIDFFSLSRRNHDLFQPKRTRSSQGSCPICVTVHTAFLSSLRISKRLGSKNEWPVNSALGTFDTGSLRSLPGARQQRSRRWRRGDLMRPPREITGRAKRSSGEGARCRESDMMTNSRYVPKHYSKADHAPHSQPFGSGPFRKWYGGSEHGVATRCSGASPPG
jgi:hypothetical protein